MSESSVSIVRRVLAGAGWLMGWRVVSRSLGFVSVLILARLLAPADFGIVAIATAVTAAIDGLSQLGVRDALVRLRDESKDHYDTAFAFQAMRGLLTGGVIAALSGFAGPLLGEPRLAPVLLVLAGGAVVGGWENIGVVRFSRELDFRMQFMLQAAPRLFGFVLTTALAFALRSYWALVWGAVAAKLAAVAMSYAVSAHRPGFSLRGWRYLLSFSAWTWASGLAMIVWTRADPFLLGPALGAGMLGVYMVAVELAILPITELIEPASEALFPGFVMAQRQGSETVAAGLRVGGVLALCAAPLAVGVSACSGFLVATLLGAEWQAAQPVIAILAWLCLFSPYSFVCATVLSAKGKLRRVFHGVAGAAALKVAALLLVRQTGDLRLIALASVLVVAAESGIFVWQLRAAGGAELRRAGWAMLRMAAAAALTAGMVRVAVPGAWQAVALDRLAALAAGAATGALSIAVFAAVQSALWTVCGRPAGPEAQVLAALRKLHAFRRVEDWWDTRAPPRQLGGIQAGRGVAASLVVLYHAARHLDKAVGAPGLAAAFQFGHAGVDVFFVTSGFIILFVHYDDVGTPARLGRYAARRATRLLPTYWVALAATAALALAAGHGLTSAADLAWAATLLPSNRPMLLDIAWTLRFEVLFYLLFGLLIAHRRAGALALAGWLATACVAAVAGWHADWLPGQFDGAYAVEFFLGMAAACLLRNGAVPRPLGMLAAGLLLFAVAAALEDLNLLDGYADPARLAYGIPAAIIVVGLAEADRQGRLRVPRVLRALGGASYSIYLFQFAFIGTVWQCLRALRLERALPPGMIFVALAVTAVAGGVAVSACVEHPLLRLMRRPRAALRVRPTTG